MMHIEGKKQSRASREREGIIMSRSSTASEPRERLRTVSRALQAIHRALLEYQRRDYERSFGRIGSDFYVLKLAADDPQFAWLRSLSAEMMRIDVALTGAVDDEDLRLIGTRLRHLLAPNADGPPFQSRYDMAMQANPEIIMAHAAVMRSLAPARRVTLFRGMPPSDIRTDDEAPGVEFRFHSPGELVPGHGDHGYRALAAIGEVIMPAGSIVPMHTQSNEDVLSWVPDGVIVFKDASGATSPVDRDHLAVMNTGSGFEHAERAPDSGGTVRMIQVFVRPSAVGLEPAFQHDALPASVPGEWRVLAGPEDSDAPFHVRNNVHISDLVLPEGERVLLPRREGWDTYVLVYDGEVDIDGVTFGPGESGLVPGAGELAVVASSAARLLAIVIDPAAKITRAGTIGR
jgi:quercetin 2,3-dioxygenase